MRKKQRAHKPLNQHSRSADVLLGLLEEMDRFHLAVYQPRAMWMYGYEGILKIREAKERGLRLQALKRLEQKRLLKLRKIGDTYNVTLTKMGVFEGLRQKILRAHLLPEGEICMVVFDIPEVQKTTRKQLRTFLSAAGFLPVQKSVWITPFDVGDLLKELFRQDKKSKWVRIYHARAV